MPKFIDEKTGVEVDTDTPDGGLGVKIPTVVGRHGKKLPVEFTLAPDDATALSEQIHFAQEYRNLYARRPA